MTYCAYEDLAGVSAACREENRPACAPCRKTAELQAKLDAAEKRFEYVQGQSVMNLVAERDAALKELAEANAAVFRISGVSDVAHRKLEAIRVQLQRYDRPGTYTAAARLTIELRRLLNVG